MVRETVVCLGAGVSHVRALSPTWTGSPARETSISRTISPQQKNQVQYFWKFSIWNFRVDEKRREIQMVKVFK
jgi:hypothetical protein